MSKISGCARVNYRRGRFSMYRRKLVSRSACTLLAVAAATFGFTGCPRNIQGTSLGKAAVILSGNLAPAKGGDVSNDSIAAIHVTVGDIILEQEDGTPVSVLPAPVDVDLLSDSAASTILAAADIPAGVYVRGTLVLTSASIEYVNDLGVLVPVGLPAGGEFDVEVEFEVIAEGQGALKLELDDIEIHVLGDDSLLLNAQFELEAEFDDPDDADDGEPDLVVGDVETAGVIDDVENEESTFEMEIGDSEIEVDYSTATILLPPATEGGEPVAGTPEDLVKDACVNVSGVLNLDDDDLVLVADSVQIVAYNCDDDDDDFDDNDDDDDDDDNGDDDNGDDDNGEDDGDDD